MKISRRAAMAGMCVVLMGSMVLPTILRGVEPTSALAGQGRSSEAIEGDLKAASKEVQDVLPSIRSVADADFRKNEGTKAIGPLRKMVGLLAELAAVQTDADAKKDILGDWYQFQSVLVGLGDAETVKSLMATAAGKDAGEAVRAKSALALGTWWASTGDAKAQGKQLDDFIALAKANPTSDDAAVSLMLMANLGAANKDLKAKALEVVKGTMTGPMAKNIQLQIAAMEKEELAMAASLKVQAEMIGKLIDISGRTSTDGKFAIGELKGKVVLVDFWATWCGPCKEELPEVKAVYKKFHDKGLEIVGVSCDGDEDLLNSFTSENGMPWVELHDKTVQSGDDFWHPLTHKFGIESIPTMYLVDKKGILRDVDPSDDLAGKVEKLLAEGDGGSQKPEARSQK